MKPSQIHLVGDFLLKFAVLLTAIAVSIGAIGIPLPIPLVKEIATAFPCMNCGCGCVNAEMCWRQCCCFSNVQKVAWAHRHGVRAPNFVLDQAAAESGAETAALAELKPCCRQRVLASRCSRSRCDTASPEDMLEETATLVPGILAFNALKCQGHSLSLTMLPPSIAVSQFGDLLPPLPEETDFISESLLYVPPCFDMVVPPPEVAIL